MKITKEVNWSYPTSDNAKRFGFYNDGCWTVSTNHLDTESCRNRAIQGYATKAEAIKHAEKLVFPFSRDWLLKNNLTQ